MQPRGRIFSRFLPQAGRCRRKPTRPRRPTGMNAAPGKYLRTRHENAAARAFIARRVRFGRRNGGTGEDVPASLHYAVARKKSLRLSEVRLTPREVKPCGFVRHFLRYKKWRREGDSNPRQGYPCDGLANRSFRPLRHLSAIRLSVYKNTPSGRNCQVQIEEFCKKNGALSGRRDEKATDIPLTWRGGYPACR